MKSSMTITAERRGNTLYADVNGKEDSNLSSDTADMNRLGLDVPIGRYRVTYYLNPHGRLRVVVPGCLRLFAIVLAENPTPGVWAHTCFLRGLGWRGKRVSRRVRRLAK